MTEARREQRQPLVTAAINTSDTPAVAQFLIDIAEHELKFLGTVEMLLQIQSLIRRNEFMT